MTCDRAAQVHAYHDRQLGPAAREAVAAHLETCAACTGLLGELQALSRLVRAAPLPDVSGMTNARYYGAWDVSRQRGVLRVAGWMTAAAAAVLVGSLLIRPHEGRPNVVATGSGAPSTWEVAALMPPPERRGDRPDELIEIAQWISDDLSSEGLR